MASEGSRADRMQHLVKGWADYRRRQRIAGWVFIGFIPLAALVALSTEALAWPDALITFFVAALAVLVLGAWTWFVLFHCPNCGGRFHISAAWSLTSGRQCPHCGLVRYQYD